MPGVRPSINDLEGTLRQAQIHLAEATLVHLSGRGRFSLDVRDQVWGLLMEVARTLAVVQGATPREILEEGFGISPPDEDWRKEILPGLQADAGRLDEGESSAVA